MSNKRETKILVVSLMFCAVKLAFFVRSLNISDLLSSSQPSTRGKNK